MKLLIGLGNPGQPYQTTRHNLGFMVIDALAKKHDVILRKNSQAPALRGEFFFNQKKILLAKPQTFMNQSGQAVRNLVSFYKIKANHLWIIYDDLDLPLGKIRIRAKGSAGGHQGVQSIIDALATSHFNRLRIGIGSNREKNLPAEKYVLQNFTAAEKKFVAQAINEAINQLTEIIK